MNEREIAALNSGLPFEDEDIVRIQANEPSMPLPEWGEGGAVDGGLDQTAVPLPEWGEGGAVDEGNQPVTLPEWGEERCLGGCNNLRPGWNIITVPIRPVTGSCVVRFLNAAYNYNPLRIVIGNRLISSGLPYTNVTPYNNIADGFRTVTITSMASPRTVLFQGTIPFSSGEVITLAIIRSANGIELLRISDISNLNNPRNMGRIRLANLVFNSPPLDLFLANGRAIFSDVRYKEVTMFKQARPREYEFYLAQTPYVIEPRARDIEVIEDMPIALPHGSFEPLVSFFVDVKPGVISTIYAMGMWSSPIRVKTIN